MTNIFTNHFTKQQNMNTDETGGGFSPLDEPVVETKKKSTSSDVPYEKIPESEVSGEATKDAPEFKLPNYDDVPSTEVPFDEPKSGGEAPVEEQKQEETKIPDNFSKEFSEYSAKWLVDVYFRLFVAGVKQYSKIDKAEVLKAVNAGVIRPEFIKFIDEANDNVDDNIKVSEEEKEFIIEPLKYFLQVKKIQLAPEWMVLTSLAMVSGSIFLNAMDIKEQNKAIIEKIVKESTKIRDEEKRKEKKKAPQNVEDVTEEKTSDGAEFHNAEELPNDD